MELQTERIVIRMLNWLRRKVPDHSEHAGPDLRQVAIDVLSAKGTPRATALAAEIDRGRRRRSGDLESWDGEPSGPEIKDTTRTATVAEYAAWLRGYITRGGTPTHFYEYPFAVAGMRYASSDVVIDSEREFGARSRSVILAPGVQATRSNPDRPFSGWGHSTVYEMDGFQRAGGSVVPAYSDPEIEELLTDEHRAERAVQRVKQEGWRRHA